MSTAAYEHVLDLINRTAQNSEKEMAKLCNRKKQLHKEIGRILAGDAAEWSASIAEKSQTNCIQNCGNEIY